MHKILLIIVLTNLVSCTSLNECPGLPPLPMLPDWSSKELACLSDNTYERVVRRDLMCVESLVRIHNAQGETVQSK